MVEFALIAVFLVFVVVGIINFGLILSFKQDMTRAAAEGARAGAVALPASKAWDEAVNATSEAVQGFDRSCGTDIDCFVNIHPCGTPAPRGQMGSATDPGDCVTVELVYDYTANPLLPRPPLISALLPETIRDSSVARLNP
jgi:Flp pilus assembly protein TadG